MQKFNRGKFLEVTKVRYFKTRRGIGYEAKTNLSDIRIWNDGYGGETYIPYCETAREYFNLTEQELESLIDTYERINSF